MSSLQRIIEPELMNDEVQVDAYASADFSESHNRLISQIGDLFPNISFAGPVLNLGCGSGDDTFRFAKAYPNSQVVAIDGARTMIERANMELNKYHPELNNRVRFLTAYVPSIDIPNEEYVAVISNSLLHHMHQPLQFWECVTTHARLGTPIFIADLRRPASLAEVDSIVSKYAGSAPTILKEDFRNSLCAAFTETEIIDQLQSIGLNLSVLPIGDRHIVIHGIRGSL